MEKEDEDIAYGPNSEGELHEGCRKCNVNFGSATELKLHFSSIHNRQTFECFVCNKLFLPKFAFLAHINRYHEDCDKSYPCQFCDKSYTNQGALDQHISSCHSNSLLSGPYDTPAPLTCPMCGKFFQQKFSLNRHIRLIHENPNPPKIVDDGKHPFKCLTCGKSYKSQSGLTMHSKLKHQHTQYKCELCSKFFSRASTVARHVDTIHNNMLTMYPCKWCGKEFRSRGGHDMHVTAEHKAIRYDCEICSKQFKRKCSLSRHLQGVHDLDNNRSSQSQHHQHHTGTNNPPATAIATMVNDTSHNMQHVPQIKME